MHWLCHCNVNNNKPLNAKPTTKPEPKAETVVQSQIELLQSINDSTSSTTSSSSSSSPHWIMYGFQKRIREIRDYHVKHGGNSNQHNTSTMMDYSLDQMTMTMNENHKRGRNRARDGMAMASTSTKMNANINAIHCITEQQNKKRRYCS